MEAVFERLDQEEGARSAAITGEREQRIAADGQLRDRLQAASTGGLHVPLIGALWLVSGVLLSTASPELEHWLNAEPIFPIYSAATNK